MSIDAMSWAKKIRTGGPNRKVVLMVLADYADEEWSCFPGQITIAAETEMSDRTVRRILVELEQAGLIRREHRQRANGSRTSDRIYLLPDNLTGRPTGQAEQVLPVNDDRPNRTPASGPEQLEEPLERTTRARRRSAPSGRMNAVRELARKLVNEWWERQDPKPQQPYLGAVKVVERALPDWGEDRLRAVLDADPPVISGGALQVAASKLNGNERGRGRSQAQQQIFHEGGGDYAGYE